MSGMTMRRSRPCFLVPRLIRLPIAQRNPHSCTPSIAQRPYCSEPSITSPQNPRIKATRALQRRRQRDREAKILLEGQRLIADALAAGLTPHELYHTQDAVYRTAGGSVRDQCAAQGARIADVSEPVMRSLCDTMTPQGLVAIFTRPTAPLPPAPSLTLICDAVSDPGNLGTLLRSAAGAGAEAVVLTEGCADVWGLKALRAGMGAQFRVPVRAGVTWPHIEAYCKQAGASIRVAHGGAVSGYADVDWAQPAALVVGSEAEGPSPDAFRVGEPISIPLCGGVESLNAAMAGTVILFEAQRQRSLVGSQMTLKTRS